MKVVQLTAYGDASALEVVEQDVPAPVNGKVRVRVEARPVNPADLGTRAGAFAAATPGLTFPAVLGWDFAGTSLDEAVVEGGEPLPAGTRVAGFVPWFGEAMGEGTYTEVVVVDPTWLAPVPDALSTPAASVLAMNALTGAQAADMFGDVTGRTVLVVGASGPVGATTVRTLAARGARVLATGSRGDDEAVAALGAEVLPRGDAAEIAAAARAQVPDGVDGVFNAGLASHELLGAVRDGGVFISATRGYMPDAERGITVDGVHVEPDADRLAGLLRDAEAGRLPARVAQELPLDQAADAHRLVEAGGIRGKVVLVG